MSIAEDKCNNLLLMCIRMWNRTQTMQKIDQLVNGTTFSTIILGIPDSSKLAYYVS
jgi:hypothetical protein